MGQMNRRSLLKTIAAAGIGAATLPACATSGRSPKSDALHAEEDFTFLHLTDIHVRRRRRGDDGYRACVAHVNELPRKPGLVLMGGDMAFDGLYNEKDEFADQIELLKSISADLPAPWYPCLGNHDLLGWNARRKVPVTDPDLGKKMILDRLGMDHSWYSFDSHGWHFVILDSLFQVEREHGPDYEPRIGEEQLHWLALDLAKANKPTVCVSHHAAFYNIPQGEGNLEALAMVPNMVLRDNRDLRYVLERHKVKALLQGHSHRTEDYLFRGVWYLTGPAVSSAWWGGTWNGFPQGYTVFHARGEQLTWERVNFPWKHHLEPEDNLERERQAQWDAFEAEQERLLRAERLAAASR